MRDKLLNGLFERESSVSFNMTPVIDIVFLLIVFFALVFKYIEAENLPVSVPAGCDFAENRRDSEPAGVTVSVVKQNETTSVFAVGAENVEGNDYRKIAADIAGHIDSRLENLPAENKTVTLRIDKDVPYYHAQYALAAVAQSSASEIRVSVIKTDDDTE